MNLVYLVQATHAFFTRFPVAFEVIEPLRDDDTALDMLNRSIAFAFFEENWSKEDVIRILETTLKRYHS